MGTAGLRPASTAPTPELRQRVAAAARELFAAQGYEQTTVDAIAERAGVGRRTFFRYFRSKDDAIFPDHLRIVADVRTYLAATAEPPVQAVCGGARVVFRSYVDEREVAVQRYRLSRSVPALQDREAANVARYTRVFSSYLRQRFAGRPDAVLRADTAAAAVVAAHNHVLRMWLRAEGRGDPLTDLDQTFAWVQGLLEPCTGPGDEETGGAGSVPVVHRRGEGMDLVLAVVRTSQPPEEVLQRIVGVL
jgi:AcrR family transcriptional regulator